MDRYHFECEHMKTNRDWLFNLKLSPQLTKSELLALLEKVVAMKHAAESCKKLRIQYKKQCVAKNQWNPNHEIIINVAREAQFVAMMILDEIQELLDIYVFPDALPPPSAIPVAIPVVAVADEIPTTTRQDVENLYPYFDFTKVRRPSFKHLERVVNDMSTQQFGVGVYELDMYDFESIEGAIAGMDRDTLSNLFYKKTLRMTPQSRAEIPRRSEDYFRRKCMRISSERLPFS